MGFLDKWLTALQDANFEDHREDIIEALHEVQTLVANGGLRKVTEDDMFEVYKKMRLAQLKAKREGK